MRYRPAYGTVLCRKGVGLSNRSSQFHADIQFFSFMRSVTNLSKDKIYSVFDMLDVDHSGLLDFDEFYLLVCILISVRVGGWVHSSQ